MPTCPDLRRGRSAVLQLIRNASRGWNDGCGHHRLWRRRQCLCAAVQGEGKCEEEGADKDGIRDGSPTDDVADGWLRWRVWVLHSLCRGIFV